MKKNLPTVLNEIRAGKNLDVYLTIIVCSIVLVLDIFNISSSEAILSAILATLLLTAVSTLNSRRTDEEIQSAITNIKSVQNQNFSALQFFSTWNLTAIEDRLHEAEEISWWVVANYDFVHKNSEVLKEFLKRGGKLRCLYLEPGGDASEMVLSRSVEVDKDDLNTQTQMCLKRMREIIKSSNSTDSHIRVFDHLPSFILTIVDSKTSEGIIFVTLNGFGQHFASRPTFALTKQKDGRWFNFFLDSFENAWSNQKSKPLDTFLQEKRLRD